MKPWENYQSQPEAQSTEGPWSNYQEAPQQSEQPLSAPEPQMSRGQAAFTTMTNPLGFGDEIKAGIAAMTAKLLGGAATKDIDIGDLYKEARTNERAKLEQARQQYPVQSFAGQIFSDVGPAGRLLKGVGLAGEGFSRAVGGGAYLGGTSGLGETEDLDNVPQSLTDVAEGTFGGGIVGGSVQQLLPGAISTAKKVVNAPRALFQKVIGVTPKSQETIKAFEEAGVSPTLANVTQGQTTKTFQNLLGNFPGSRGEIEKATQRQVDQIAKQIAGITKSEGGTIQEAGKIIKEGAINAKQTLERKIKSNYDQLDKFIPTEIVGGQARQSKIPTTNLREAFKDESVADSLVNNKQTSEVLKNYQRRLDSFGDEAGNMPYSNIKSLRSTIGRKMQTALMDGDETSSLKKLYGALSEDMKAAVIDKGGEKGLQAFNKANNAFGRYQDALESKINPLIKAKTPSKVYNLVLSGTKQGGTDARRIMKVLDPQQGDFVRGTIAREMGLANEGLQDAKRGVFSPNKFLTEYNKMQKIGTEKDLFTTAQNESLKNLNKAIESIKETSKARQSSNNLPYLTWLGLLSGTSFSHPAAALGSVVGAKITAKMMMNPGVVNWLAKAPKIKPSQIPAHLNQLSTIAAANPDIRDNILDYLKSITVGDANAADIDNDPPEDAIPTKDQIRQQLIDQQQQYPSLMADMSLNDIDARAEGIKKRYYK